MNIAQMLAYGPKLGHERVCTEYVGVLRARLVEARAARRDKWIERYEAAFGGKQITKDEFSAALGIMPVTASARLVTLRKKGYVRKCGEIRTPAGGIPKFVYEWVRHADA